MENFKSIDFYIRGKTRELPLTGEVVQHWLNASGRFGARGSLVSVPRPEIPCGH